MKNLILLSKHFNQNAADKLELAAGKDLSEIKVLFSSNAGDLASSKDYIELSKNELRSFGVNFDEVDLKQYEGRINELVDLLGDYDATFFTGGSAMYLTYLFHKLGLIDMYRELVEGGLIHIGFSAGAMICSPHTKFAQVIDSTEGVPEIYKEALNLIPLHIAPHYVSKPKYTKAYELVLKKFPDTTEKIIPLTNDQGIYFSNNDWEIF